MWLARFTRIFLALLIVLAWSGRAALAKGENYILAPQDTLRITIVEWQPDLGVSRDWSAINGDYEIDAEGKIYVPYVGVIEASGQTSEQLAGIIAGSLRKKLGLSGFPHASVAIAEYRPVFITGQVQRPGMYPFFPGMNVLKLVSVAGGIAKPVSTTNDTTRELISHKGALDQLVDERVALLATKARLEAEIAKKDEIDFPDEITGHPDFDAITGGEKILKEARELRLNHQLIALKELTGLLNSQLVSLGKKSETLEEQEKLAAAELEGVQTLADKGLTVNSRIRTAHQFLSQTQTNSLSTETDRLRVKQELNRADRDGTSLVNDWNAELATELQLVDGKLRVVDLKIGLTRDLLSNAVTSGTVNLPTDESAYEIGYAILRAGNGEGETAEIRANENHAVEPGDVVKVEIEFTKPDS